jgi:hypothetical protein
MFKRITPSLRAASTKQATTTGRTILKPALEGDERSPRSTPPKATPSPSSKIEPVPHKNHETNKPQKKTTPAVDTSTTKLAIFDRNVKAMQEKDDEKNPVDRKSEKKPALPTAHKPITPKTTSSDSNIPKEFGSIASIMSDMANGFDFTGWDNMSAAVQRSSLQRAGMSDKPMMQLLNAGTSLETIAIVQDIERNKNMYGLSPKEVRDISEKLFEIANARIGAKNRELTFLTNPAVTKVFLQTLDEKESELIGPFMDRKGRTEVPHPADNTKIDNRIPLRKGEYIDYNTIDLTDDLYKFMRDSSKLLTNLKETAKNRKADFMDEFIELVKTHGALDIKHQDPWKFRNGLTYLFNGEVMRNDDPGNIAFGYYGASVYGKDFLHLGAGYYQLKSDIKNGNPIQWGGKFFDDPQDYDMIEYGYRLYMEEHPD